MGFLAMSLTPNNAFMLLNHLLGVQDCRLVGIRRFPDGSYRYTGSNGHSSAPLDYQIDQKGTVIQQEMWRPMQPGDIHRHFENARMQWPIFFLSASGGSQGVIVGVDLALAGHPGLRQIMVQPDMASPLGGLTTTHLCLKACITGF